MPEFIVPDWPAPSNVRALSTLRSGGVSAAPYESFNLGDHVGDDPAAVAANRNALRRQLPVDPCWLKQVHGTRCVDADSCDGDGAVEADASVSRNGRRACAIMTADCLPILICDAEGSVVAAAHAGWRGLLAGVIESVVEAMRVPGTELLAWLGPAIGPLAFEVGEEVRAAFGAEDERARSAFASQGDGKWLCDIYALARLRLARAGVHRIYGGNFCTWRERERFFSYRRDGVTGRMASVIWLEP